MKEIKVGLLIDDMSMPAWVKRMLESISREDGVSIALVVKNAIPPRKKSVFERVTIKKNFLLMSLWRELDKRVFRVKHDALKMVDLSAVLSDIPTIHVIPKQKMSFDYFSKRDVDAIVRHEITVFLQLGFRTLHGDILNAASCGVWSYQHVTNPIGRSGYAGVWEVLSNSTTTSSALQLLTEDPQGGKVLYRSWSATDPFSIHRNLNNYYWKTLSFVPRSLRELKQIGEAEFQKKYVHTDAIPVDREERWLEDPDNKALAKLLTGLSLKILSRAISKVLSMEQWTLLYRFDATDGLPMPPFGFKELLPPKDRFWADPCVIEHHGKHVIFMEELEYANPTGYLSVIEFDSNGHPLLPPVKVLTKPYHLSYPFVFEDNSVLYMIPETQGNHTIELYRCSEFPHKWEFVMNLMENVNAVDTIIWKHDEKYWLFTSLVENDGASYSDELFLYSSKTLMTSNWRPHPCNPIVSDVRCARSAGRIFQYDGHWYRPAQDCSGRYGSAVSIQRIELIDEKSYRETPASRIDANWDKDVIRTHTISRMGSLTCIDGLRRRRRFWTDDRSGSLKQWECGADGISTEEKRR